MVKRGKNSYKFITFDEKDKEGNIRHIVKAITHYGGNAVHAYACCSPADEYDEEFGKKLARARVDARVAAKRLKKAKERSLWAETETVWFAKMYNEWHQFFVEALIDYNRAVNNLEEIEHEK